MPAVLLTCFLIGTRAISVELMLEPKPQFQWRKTTISVKKNHSFLWRKITISEEEIDSWYWGKNHRRLFMSWQAGSTRTAQVSGLTNGCHLLWLLLLSAAILSSTLAGLLSTAAEILSNFETSSSGLCPLCNTVIYFADAILSNHHLLCIQCNTCQIYCVLLSTIYSVCCTFIFSSCVGCTLLS